MTQDSFHFENRNIGLALSGGGVRAVAFHAGVLRWFAEKKCLDRITHVSSVSGGSLFTGLMFHFAGYKWPDSIQYKEDTFHQIKELLTSKSLQSEAIYKLIFNPFYWKFFLSRAQVISRCIESSWGITATLEQLPSRPVWSINGTTAENGRRFRFKGTKIGDYRIGYAEAKKYKLATAMAVSAAFPGGIGPITLDTKLYKWHKKEFWGAHTTEIIAQKFKKIHLYDGGVYDNLGLEPLFDVGEQKIKSNSNDGNKLDFVIVSDAGAPFIQKSIPGPLSIGRLKRVADVAFDQCRALRIRAYVNFIKQNPDRGMYFQIGFNPYKYIEYCHEEEILNSKKIYTAANYPTNLRRMKENDFETLAMHGYETACANEILFLKF